jgi:Na+-transporting methylmalonyl-CoA/oxaloacetate decarboxylase gamma subunit
MTWIVATVLLALLLPLLTRGSYTKLLQSSWQWTGVLALGLAIQVALEVVEVPESRFHDVGYGALVASYVLLLGFCGANLVRRGMGIVFLGIFLNALVITVNQGMPVDLPDAWRDEGPVETTVKHHEQTDDDRLLVLNDIVPVPGPWQTVVSFGDLIMTVGLLDVAFHASRRRRATRRPSTAPSERSSPALADDDRAPHGPGNGTGADADAVVPRWRVEHSVGGRDVAMRDDPPERFHDASVVEVAGR